MERAREGEEMGREARGREGTGRWKLKGWYGKGGEDHPSAFALKKISQIRHCM